MCEIMPRYNTPPTEGVRILSPEKIKKVFDNLKTLGDQAYFSSVAMTAGRISEILSLKKEDVDLTDGFFVITLETKKLGGGRYYPPKRTLKFKFNAMLNRSPPYCYYEAIYKYSRLLPNPDSKLFTFCSRTGENKISRWTKEFIGVPLAPHIFRHYRLTALANKGYGMQDLRYIKGAKKLQSVEAYIQAREQEIEI